MNPQPHCEHECVCPRYKDWAPTHNDGICPCNIKGAYICDFICPHDTRSRPAASATNDSSANSIHDDEYWKGIFAEKVKECHNCDDCIPLGKRPKPGKISDGRFDTKEDCCRTRSMITGCPVSIKVKRMREQEEHDAAIEQKAREKVLDVLENNLNEIRAKYANQCIEARKQGYACGVKRSIEISVVRKWIESLRSRL